MQVNITSLKKFICVNHIISFQRLKTDPLIRTLISYATDAYACTAGKITKEKKTLSIYTRCHFFMSLRKVFENNTSSERKLLLQNYYSSRSFKKFAIKSNKQFLK